MLLWIFNPPRSGEGTRKVGGKANRNSESNAAEVPLLTKVRLMRRRSPPSTPFAPEEVKRVSAGEEVELTV